MLTRLLAASLALVSVPAIPQATPMTPAKLIKLLPRSEPLQPDVVFQDYPLVKRVDCIEGRGSGFRVGENHMFTAAHVASLTNCMIEQMPISVTEQDDLNDFASFDVADGVPHGLAIDCDGYKPSHWYWAIGYAMGRNTQTAVQVYATIFFDPDGQRILIGHHAFVPGMSGGPVIDPDTGKVVGIVNAYDPANGISISSELKFTSACGA